jgi:NADPH:quinone reductase-like Zn-dependent oxidoreductase
MKAVVHDRYGPADVLRIAEVEQPVPNDDEVLVEVLATTVNRTDCGVRAARPFFARAFTGLVRPKRRIAGMELAGRVAAVGPAVTRFKVGDGIFGIKGGANAEYACVRESGPVAPIPGAMTFAEAAAVSDGACTALSCLRAAGTLEGCRLVVYGASGSVGTAAVQLGRYLGAHVTAVCNTKNVDLVRSLGADEVVDYTREDFTKNGQTYDVIFDAVGKLSFRRSRRSLRPGGMFIETDLGFMWHAPLLALVTKWIGSRRIKVGIARYRQEDVLLLKELIEAGRYRAVIDRRYPLAEAVEATKYVETGQKTGNVVLTIGPA